LKVQRYTHETGRNEMRTLFIYLVFPGFAFTALAGMMASWLERKITARLQWRVGPPWYQSFADMAKLCAKVALVPAAASRIAFLCAPAIGLAGVIVASGLLGGVDLGLSRGCPGDLALAVCLLLTPPLSLIIGGAASRHQLALLGVRREMRLTLARECPFILASAVPVLKAGMTLRVAGLLAHQQAHGSFLWSPSGALAFAVSVVCMQAKLGYVPFDASEADTEINSGPLIEYSGPLLALFRLTRMMVLIALPVYLLTLFVGGAVFRGWGIGAAVLEYGVLLLLITLIKNTNPRLRIDQAQRFFLGPVTAVAAAAVLLALAGR